VAVRGRHGWPERVNRTVFDLVSTAGKPPPPLRRGIGVVPSILSAVKKWRQILVTCRGSLLTGVNSMNQF
jgi:hypothetical protein